MSSDFTPAAPSDSPLRVFSRVAHGLRPAGIWLALAILAALGLAFFPRFGAAENLANILRNVALLGIVSSGLAFIVYGRHYIDLSMPATMALTGFVAVGALPLGLVPALGLALLAGLAVGAVNGWAVGYLRVNPIIWTLASAFVLDGFLRWSYAGRQSYPDAATTTGSAFVRLGQAESAGLPLAVWLLLGLAGAGQWLLRRSRFGRQLQSAGIAPEVAALSGVRVSRVILISFVTSSCATTIAGVLLTAMNRQATFDTGSGYDFNALTAVVIGGVVLQGGRGSILGVLGGVLVMGVLMNLMTLAGLDSFEQMVAKGVVFVAVVGVSTWMGRKSGGSDE